MPRRKKGLPVLQNSRRVQTRFEKVRRLKKGIMARPTRDGFDYFPLDVDIMQDKAIRRAVSKFGSDAFAIYIYILCECYRDKGYYLVIDDDFLFTASETLRITEKKIIDVLVYLESKHLFKTFDYGDYSILTSSGIQRRWLKVRQDLRRKSPINIIQEVWLLEEKPSDDVVSYTQKSENYGENPQKSGVITEKTPQKKGKEKKGNEKKRKEKQAAYGAVDSLTTRPSYGLPRNDCEICGGKGWIVERIGLQDYAKPCRCKKEEHNDE
jgi:hypothetical protein